MEQIRNGVFETNSSSTHSMAIPHNLEKIPKYIYFYIGEYGWETGSPDPASYLWTAICYNCENFEQVSEYKKKLSNICDKYNIGRDYEIPEYEEYGLKHGYIDHGIELMPFIKMLFNDEDKLIKFISGGEVFTGNDNNDEERNYINREDKFIDQYDYDNHCDIKVENPYYNKDLAENYDWYYKEN